MVVALVAASFVSTSRANMSLTELKDFSTKVYSRGRKLSYDLTSGMDRSTEWNVDTNGVHV